MITVWLIEHPWANAAGLAALLLLGPPLGMWLARHRRLAWTTACASLLPVVVLTTAPTGRPRPTAGCTVQWALPDLGAVEPTANVLLFALPALLVAVATRRPGATLLGGVLASAAIEAVQAVALDLGRACDTSDWLCNGLGAALGAGLGWLALTAAARGRGRARRAAAPGGPRPAGTAPSSPPARHG